LTAEARDHSPASVFQLGSQWEQSMDKALGVQNTIVGNAVLLASRVLLAGIFVHEGVFLATNFAVASATMAKVGVPALALIGTIALQLVAGIAIAVGWHTRLGAAALGLFCLATAILFHTNFTNRNELLHFEKDLAIAGGMFVLMLRGAGAYSVGSLARRRISFDVVGDNLLKPLGRGRMSATTRTFRKG
jgi:putative oxidoreductase